MKIIKIEKGLVNDDFIRNWVTLKVTDEKNNIYPLKIDLISQTLHSFHFDSDTFETTLNPVDKIFGQAVVEYMVNNKISWE